MAPPGLRSTISIIRRFRRDPGLSFLRHSRFGVARAVAAVAERLFTRPVVHALLLDPVDLVLRANIPVATSLAHAYDRAARRRRTDLLERHGMPSVSVVMPALNAQETLRAAISSVLTQSYANVELIVVDDGSVDGTLALAREMAADDPRVVVTQNPGPRGASRARNVGLSQATGDYVAFHDADDISDRERLERQLAALLAWPSAVVCVCNARRIDERGETVPINGRRVARGVITMLFRRAQVVSTLGYFKTELVVSEDSEYYERIKATFGEACAIDLFKTLYHQRFSPTSLLFSDGTVELGDGGDVSHRRSREADEALARFRADLRRIEKGELDPYVPF